MWDTKFFKGEMWDKDGNYNFSLASMSELTLLSVRYHRFFEDFSYQWLLLYEMPLAHKDFTRLQIWNCWILLSVGSGRA